MVENLPKMTGKVVAVTGCTSGTGKIFAQVGVEKIDFGNCFFGDTSFVF